MRRTAAVTISLLFIFSLSSGADDSAVRKAMLGSAYADHGGHRVLQRICDEAGGRLPGSPNDVRTLRILEEELGRNGIAARQEPFVMPGWIRGDDAVEVLLPFGKKLRAAALGYVEHHPPFESSLIWGGYGLEKELSAVAGSIALVTSESPREGEAPLRSEVITRAARAGARAVLFINDKPGGLVLAGVSNFQGNPSAVPAYSITMEEGLWLRRLLESRHDVRIRLSTASRCTLVQTANLVATLPGKRKARIVVGAHVDSWDISQGAVDNGIGAAVLFDVARIFAAISRTNLYTVEFVWLNGEELGIWGAKKYLEQHARDSIAAMVNMDMPGSPRGVNVMGSDEFIPMVRALMDSLKGFDWSGGITSAPWTNSDQQPFLLEGIPAFVVNGRLEKESVFHYHDFGDTFDKVDRRALVDASAATALLTHLLANNTTIEYRRKSVEERIATFKSSGMEKRLRRQNEWPY